VVKYKNKWIKNAIIYHILIDRFSSNISQNNWEKPIFLGGTIKGIIDKIQYLQNLGVNTLWISPFYKTNAYHGYHITDFFEVDPHFGSKNDIQKLITIVHESNMKIIADFVPNHCSFQHPFFIDAQKNRNSKYHKWFHFLKWPDSYLCFLSFKDIPKLNLENKDAREHIIQSANYWLSFGFDGFRLDHVIGPSNKFWNYFSSNIKKKYPSTILIGEAWMQGIKFNELRTIKMKGKYLKWMRGHSSDYLLKSYQGLLDGVLDFHGQQLIQNYSFNQKYTIKEIVNILNKHYKLFDSNYFLPLFLDNHDMDRMLFTCNNNKNILKKMAMIQFSVKQPIIIYYGTEIGMTQQQSIWDSCVHGDIVARQPMQWNNFDEELFLFYQNLCHKRSLKRID